MFKILTRNIRQINNRKKWNNRIRYCTNKPNISHINDYTEKYDEEFEKYLKKHKLGSYFMDDLFGESIDEKLCEIDQFVTKKPKELAKYNKYKNFYVVGFDYCTYIKKVWIKKKLVDIYGNKFQVIETLNKNEVNSLADNKMIIFNHKMNDFIKNNAHLIDLDEQLKGTYEEKNILLQKIQSSFDHTLIYLLSDHIKKTMMNERLRKYDHLITESKMTQLDARNGSIKKYIEREIKVCPVNEGFIIPNWDDEYNDDDRKYLVLFDESLIE